MIIESIITWFMSIFNYAVDLLPNNGSSFNSIPDLSFTFLKYITLVNGYIPIKEIGATFVLMIAVYAVMYGARLAFATYTQLIKLIP